MEDENKALLLDSQVNYDIQVNLNQNNQTFVSNLFSICNKNKKFLAYGTIGVLNGFLYYYLAQAGLKNIERIIAVSDEAFDTFLNIEDVVASTCYMMFYYKILTAINFCPKNKPEAIFSFFGPFAASSFLTGGIEGALKKGFSDSGAGVCGFLLFFFRVLSCIDGCVKFPDRLREIKEDYIEAWRSKNYKELFRVALTIYGSVGYSISSTDPIYSAMMKIFTFLHIPKEHSISKTFFYVSSVLGGLGNIPMSLYWTHRGIKQLTKGGIKKANEDNMKDPTDTYTGLSVPFTLCQVVGAVGGATGTTPYVFGKLGYFSDFIRLSSAFIFSMSAVTPGMANFLRNSASTITSMGLTYSFPAMFGRNNHGTEKTDDPEIDNPGDTSNNKYKG